VTTTIASQRLFRGQMKKRAMKFTSTRLIAADIKSLVSYYEKVTNRLAKWVAPVFAEILTPAATLSIGARKGQALHVSCVTVRASGTQLLVRAQNEGAARNDMDGTDLFALIGALA
jgi:hypothetical protein